MARCAIGSTVWPLNGHCEVEGSKAYGCSSDGLELSDYCTVRNCTVVNNGTGLMIGNDCMVVDCFASSNSLTGIYGGSSCSIAGCQANNNVNDGFYLGDYCNVSKCVADNNPGDGFDLGNNCQIRDCVANANGGEGIFSRLGGTIKDCAANTNGFGIGAFGNAVIADNNASGNIDNGIETQGTGNRIENNQTLNNGAGGILSEGGAGADVIIRNTSPAMVGATIAPQLARPLGPSKPRPPPLAPGRISSLQQNSLA